MDNNVKKIVPIQKNNERRRRKRQLVVVVMIIFLTFYTLINLLIVGFVYFSFNNTSDFTSYPLNYYDGKRIVASSENPFIDRVMYVSYYSLDALCNLSIMGDNQKITIFLGNNRDYMECFNNSSLVFFNGVPTRIDNPVIFTLNDYLLPAEIFTDYVIGLKIVFNQAKSVYDISYADSSQKLYLNIKAAVPCEKPSIPD